MKYSYSLAALPLLSGVLAAPAEKQSRPSVGGPLKFKKHPDTGFITDSNWAGAVQEGNGWISVTAETVIPVISGGSQNAGAAGWVGIDGKWLGCPLI